MNKEDTGKVIAKICIAGNAVRRVNVNGRELLIDRINDSELDQSVKDVLLRFATQYMDGRSKQQVVRMMIASGISEANTDKICDLACLNWDGDITCQ